MNKWTKQVPVLTRRTRAVAAVLEGNLYIMGGSDGERTQVCDAIEKDYLCPKPHRYWLHQQDKRLKSNIMPDFNKENL